MPGTDQPARRSPTHEVQRVFLDWNAPCLEQAARWLIDASDAPGVRDLEGTLCVVPGKRAGRLLLARLLHECGQRHLPLSPPRIATPRVMVNLLTTLARPPLHDQSVILASPVESRIAWIESLRHAPPADREPILPHPPEPDDLNAWLALAQMIGNARSELAGARKSFADAATWTAHHGLDHEADRWQALCAIERDYRARLRDAGLSDADDARERCLNDPARHHDFNRIVIIAAADLNELQRAALQHAETPISALIHAPESLAERFDEIGCVLPDAWRNVPVELDDSRHTLEVADRPADQAQVAMNAVAQQETQREPAEVTIGIADDSLAGVLKTAAVWAGLPVHDAAGTPLDQTAPALLLGAIADWLEDPRFVHFAALLRLPEIEAVVDSAIEPKRGRAHWLTLLDDYFADHLQQRLTGTWLAKPRDTRSGDRASAMKAVWEAIREMLAPLDGPPRPLHEWAEAITHVLEAIYRRVDGSHALIEQVRAVAQSIHLIGHEPARGLALTVDAHDALRLVLSLLGSESIPAAARAGEVDLLGWLELHLDAAPMLVLAGVNDGSLPSSRRGDALLPDLLCAALGLPCNDRRYARDAYLLNAVLHSRESVTLIAGARAAEGDPLTPSRLLLACDDKTLVRRVRHLCDDVHHAHVSHPLGVGAPTPVSAFAVPELPADLEIPTALSVTAFRSYLECPYRFALTHLCGLRQRGVTEAELDPMLFGSLAHDVLESFGADESVRDTTKPERIQAFLADALYDIARQRFGSSPPAAVRVQIARLEARLRDFAPVQAQLAGEGWRIVHCEHSFKDGVALYVPGQDSMMLRGTIDRIDQHNATGAFRIIDYKTGDRGASPMKAHHGRERYHDEWIDLQLPLYDFMARQGLLNADASIEHGYIVLPRQTNGAAYRPADWTRVQVDQAVDIARDIVMKIRDREFPRNTDIRPEYDAYARITQSTTFASRLTAGALEEGE